MHRWPRRRRGYRTDHGGALADAGIEAHARELGRIRLVAGAGGQGRTRNAPAHTSFAGHVGTIDRADRSHAWLCDVGPRRALGRDVPAPVLEPGGPRRVHGAHDVARQRRDEGHRAATQGHSRADGHSLGR